MQSTINVPAVEKLSHRNTCYYCDRHSPVIHGAPNITCERCFSDRNTKLQVCSGCSQIRYCGTHCQRKHWPEHKKACRAAQVNIQTRAKLGPQVEARHKAFVRWTKRSQLAFTFAFCWGMGIGTASDLSQSHVMLVHVDVEEHIVSDGKPEFKFLIRSAVPTTEQEIISRFQPRWSAPVRITPAQKDTVRVWAEDDGLPYGLEVTTCEVELADLSILRSALWANARLDWVEDVKRRIAGEKLEITQGLYNSENDEARRQDNERWGNEHSMRLGFAGLLALDVKRNPNKVVTHCFVVYIKVDERRTAQGRLTFRHSVQRTEVRTLREMDDVYHCDVSGALGRGILNEVLEKAPPKALRVFVVDNGLPFPKSVWPFVMATDNFNFQDISSNNPGGWLARMKELVDEK
ncbi:mizip protein [Moniliophthora roreri]|nr:mizip protein [Moniliophthora roreri]